MWKKPSNFCSKGDAYLHPPPTCVLVVGAEQKKAGGADVPGFLSQATGSKRPHIYL